MPRLSEQVTLLLMLAVPVACIAWTVTHEEVFREVREWLNRRRDASHAPAVRKFYYLFTCEYCFSHWVTIGLLAITNFRLVYDDWRGLGIAGFSLVWVANVYMSLFGRVRLDLKHERIEIAAKEAELPPD